MVWYYNHLRHYGPVYLFLDITISTSLSIILFLIYTASKYECREVFNTNNRVKMVWLSAITFVLFPSLLFLNRLFYWSLNLLLALVCDHSSRTSSRIYSSNISSNTGQIKVPKTWIMINLAADAVSVVTTDTIFQLFFQSEFCSDYLVTARFLGT